MAQSNGDETKVVIMPPNDCEHGVDLNIATCHRCDGTAIYTEQDRKQHELEASKRINDLETFIYDAGFSKEVLEAEIGRKHDSIKQ